MQSLIRIDVPSRRRIGAERSGLACGHLSRARRRVADKYDWRTDSETVDTASEDYDVAWHAHIAPSAVEESQVAHMVERTAERCNIASYSDLAVAG